MRTKTILISSAGRRNQLLQCFRDDAKRLGMAVRVLAADAAPALSPACQSADEAFAVPRCSAADYVPALLTLCREHHVDLLVPTIDPELAVLSRHATDFLEYGTRVVVSAPSVVALAGNKVETARQLSAAGISTPRTLSISEYLEDPGQLSGRVIAKPRGGSASVGILHPAAPAELAGVAEQDYLVQEFWQGAEYTVNLFFDREGALRCAVPHRRLEVRSGEVSKGRTERMADLAEAAERLGSVLRGARGPLCFQAIHRAPGDYAVFEINARFGGGFPLAHRAGARFSQWLLEESTGMPSTATDDWKQNVTMLRYDHAVFIDG